MYCFKDIIDEVENNITSEIDVKELAKKANMSIYEFRRIFTFVAGISIGEYIRKRKLSLSALELYEKKNNVTEISRKYGYDSPSSFSRAFKEFHGISPKEVLDGNNQFKLLTKISSEIITTGGMDVSYSIFKKDKFSVSGFFAHSDMTDTECCEDVWDKFYKSSLSEKICKKSDKIYAVYENGVDYVNCYLGITGDDYSDKICLPASEWVSFKLNRTEDTYVNEFYRNILNQWFSSVGYEKNIDIPNVEVFPSDMSEDNFEWEIWIPIKRRNEK